jgi:HK97 family phage prohead protease
MTKSAAAISLADFHTRVSAGVKPRSPVTAQFKFAADVIGADVETRSVPFVFSDNSVDSYGDTIDAKGWQWDRTGAGTIALYGHDSSAVDNIIGRAHNVRVEGNKLLGEITFATADENPNAERVFRLVKAGILNSVSVGFQPLEWTQAKDRNRPGGIDFKKQKLLEISVVGIPANENAIAQARAFGLDVEGLKFDAPPVSAVPAVISRAAPSYLKRGLYSVSALASILSELGWIEDSVEWEAEYEGDGSEIPARLLDAMKTLGQILIDMTIEEVSELLADDDAGEVDLMDGLVSLEAPTPAQKLFAALVKMSKVRTYSFDLGPEAIFPFARNADCTFSIPRGALSFVARAGKVLSSANDKTLRDAHDMMTKGCDMVKGVFESAAPEPDDVTEKSADNDRAARLRDLELLEFSSH